ncbi:MAG: PilZ domain-containing protein [Terracidiphilus sp.]
MAELPYMRNATVRKLDGGGNAGSSSQFVPGAEPSKVCAYNQTRQRFLSVDVEAADFSPAILNDRLPTLTSGCGLGLWIVPFRGVSPTSVRFPIDLVYLNADGVVLCVVDSFPISPVPPLSAQASSVLALPAQSISSTATCRGDQLLLCPSEEMKQRLQQLAEAKPDAAPEPSQSAASASNRSAQKAAGNVLPWVDRSKPTPAVENPLAIEKPVVAENAAPAGAVPAPRTNAQPAIQDPPIPSIVPAPDQPEQAPGQEKEALQPWVKRHKAPKGWLQKLLASAPTDPRRAPRVAIPWLGAYFFTGGKPVAYAVRDISTSGMYVLTEERWYPGTVIRVTLTDRRDPTPDRSITVNALVARPGNDGVGLAFVLNEDIRSGKGSVIDSQAQGIDRDQIELFLYRVSQGAQ